MVESPREAALRIVRTLRDGGHEAYLAGGCVRDELLGLAPKDYDVATDATPSRVGSLFRRTREVGKSFGVMLVSMGAFVVEVTTFRREHGYSDRRRPDSVEFCDAVSDAHRRDFTINALFIDPLAPPEMVRGVAVAGHVIDHVGGLVDMDRALIRAVGDPERRLAEDNLRALRAVRFAARLGFAIEESTARAIRQHAAELAGVSRERIGDELRRMLAERSRADAASLIETLGLDAPVFDEPPRASTSDVGVLRSLAGPAPFSTALAAWAIDRTGPAAFDGERAALVARYRRALCLSNDERAALDDTLEGLSLLVHRWDGLRVAWQKRAAASAWFAQSAKLLDAIDEPRAARLEARVHELEASEGGIAPTPLVTGDDLVAAGIAPGPMFGKWLDAVYDAQLEGGPRTRSEALELARSLSTGWGGGR